MQNQAEQDVGGRVAPIVPRKSPRFPLAFWRQRVHFVVSLRMKRGQPISKLEDLPYIGSHIAADLRNAGIRTPEELSEHLPLKVYNRLEKVMGHRHDPCVLYTLLSVEHYFATDEVVPWWGFADIGKEMIRLNNAKL